MNAFRRQKTILRREREAVPAELARSCPPVLARIYAARGISHPDELESSLRGLVPPTQLSGMEAALDLLETALKEGQRILILGDFDADGATSTTLAVQALKAMGAGAVDFRVPDRFEFGYGLTPELVADLADPLPDLLMTVDNGVTSLEGVKAAQARGMQVLVTDHHLPGAELPAAEAIVNPNLPGDAFPSKNLAGVGVVFYLMTALRNRLDKNGWFTDGRTKPNMAAFLDLVALGTVADVVPLDRNNRILVEQGIRRIRAGEARKGILGLLAVANRNPASVVATDLGFAVGPRLNAAGRLENMAIGIECLLAEEPARARELARRLDELNRERREIEGEMQAQALDTLYNLLERLEGEADLPRGLCLHDGDWHPGVVGILASRLKDRLHRPVIVFADDGPDRIKGSARSIAGFHIRDALELIDARHPGLIGRFGGHAMAAGLSLEREALTDFREAFETVAAEQIAESDMNGVILTDGELEPGEINLATAESLRFGGPWGQGFPEPMFDGQFRVVESRPVGNGKHMKLSLRPMGEGMPVDAIAFNVTREDLPESVPAIRAAYRLDVNEFRGRKTAQLIIEYLEPA